MKVSRFVSMEAAVQSHQLPFLGPVPLFPYTLKHILGRLLGHLNARKIWQVSDLLRQRAVCPLHDVLEAVYICGVGHVTMALDS